MAEIANEFSWSKSRDELFRECRRKYYYDKYGSWGGWDSNADERARTLYILKRLKSRHMWMGEIVHWAVEGILSETRSGRTPTAADVTARITARMRKEFRESRDRLYLKDPKRCCGLYEHEYEVPLDNDAWFSLHEKAKACALHLLDSKIFAEIRAIPPERWLTLEGLLDMGFENDRIFLKMDFASRDDGGILIVDWKTGGRDDVDSNVQLGCYGLYAVHEWSALPEQVTTVEYNLSGRSETRKRLIPANIDWIKHYIRSSVASMKSLLVDRAGNTAREDDFPFADNELTCKWCSFRRYCRKFADD